MVRVTFTLSHIGEKSYRGHVSLLSRVRLFVTPWAVAYEAPPSMGFSRQEYWSGLPFPSPGDLPDPGIKPRSPALQADTLPSRPPGDIGHSIYSTEEGSLKEMRNCETYKLDTKREIIHSKNTSS